MKLMELLHSIKKEKEDGLINIEDWNFPHTEHLISMGFEIGDDFHFNTDKKPKMSVFQKTEVDAEGKKVKYFHLKDEGREDKKFKEFNDLIEYFDTYSQAEIDDKKE